MKYMKIKRLFSFIIALCLIISVARAEENKSSLFDSIGEWIEQAWNDASKWISQAGQDTASWAETTWGDASKVQFVELEISVLVVAANWRTHRREVNSNLMHSASSKFEMNLGECERN